MWLALSLLSALFAGLVLGFCLHKDVVGNRYFQAMQALWRTRVSHVQELRVLNMLYVEAQKWAEMQDTLLAVVGGASPLALSVFSSRQAIRQY